MCREKVIHNFHSFFHKWWKNQGKVEIFSGGERLVN